MDTELGPIHTMLHVSVPSPFHLRSVRVVCVQTVRRVQSPSRTAWDMRPAIISIKYATRLLFFKRQLAPTALMLDEEEKNAALSDKKKRTWVHKCFRNRKPEGAYWLLYKELAEDEMTFYQYFRMPKHQLNYLLQKIIFVTCSFIMTASVV